MRDGMGWDPGTDWLLEHRLAVLIKLSIKYTLFHYWKVNTLQSVRLIEALLCSSTCSCKVSVKSGKEPSNFKQTHHTYSRIVVNDDVYKAKSTQDVRFRNLLVSDLKRLLLLYRKNTDRLCFVFWTFIFRFTFLERKICFQDETSFVFAPPRIPPAEEPLSRLPSLSGSSSRPRINRFPLIPKQPNLFPTSQIYSQPVKFIPKESNLFSPNQIYSQTVKSILTKLRRESLEPEPLLPTRDQPANA